MKEKKEFVKIVRKPYTTGNPDHPSFYINIREAVEEFGFNKNQRITVYVTNKRKLNILPNKEVMLEKWAHAHLLQTENVRFNCFLSVVGRGIDKIGKPELATPDNYKIYSDLLHSYYHILPEKVKKRIEKLEEKLENLEKEDYEEWQKINAEITELKEIDSDFLFEKSKKKYPDANDWIIEGAIYDFKHKISLDALSECSKKWNSR